MRIPRNHTEIFLGRNLRNSSETSWENSKKAKDKFKEREGKISGKHPGTLLESRGEIPRKQAQRGKCLKNIMGFSRKQHVKFL